MPFEYQENNLKRELHRNLSLRLGFKDYKIYNEKFDTLSYNNEDPTVFTYYEIEELNDMGETVKSSPRIYSTEDSNYFRYKKYSQETVETNSSKPESPNYSHLNIEKEETSNWGMGIGAFFIFPVSLDIVHRTEANNIYTFSLLSGSLFYGAEESYFLTRRFYLGKGSEAVPPHGLFLSVGVGHVQERDYVDYVYDYDAKDRDYFGVYHSIGYSPKGSGFGVKIYEAMNYGDNLSRHRALPFVLNYTFWL